MSALGRKREVAGVLNPHPNMGNCYGVGVAQIGKIATK